MALLEAGHLRAAADFQEDRVAVEPQVRPGCHVIAHVLLAIDGSQVRGQPSMVPLNAAPLAGTLLPTALQGIFRRERLLALVSISTQRSS